jgi:hypothetical protein
MDTNLNFISACHPHINGQNKEDKPNNGRHVEGFRYDVWEELGQESSIRGVFTQQQLSS